MMQNLVYDITKSGALALHYLLETGWVLYSDRGIEKYHSALIKINH